jgi:tetratricopeptide (TPR) repeat protein
LEGKDVAPLLAALFAIPFDGRYAALDMAPPEQKERTIAALIALFEGLTKDIPVLALLEDAHWIDPTSLDVFGRLVDRLSNLRALLVITFRPEFGAPWVGRAHVASLSLSRFVRRQALAMVNGVSGRKALPAEVLEQIIAKTDGVPLFVEELTKTVLESGLLREENGAYVLDREMTPLAIPSTLQDSLMERLDRLAPVKEIAQIGAAIGREFSHRLLEAVSPLQGPALQDALGQLITAELIHARGAPPEATYVFKHALVQDTAYSSLLRSRRQRIHADIARALAERFSDQVESAPANIAHHYTEAGLHEPATRSWLAASELALSRSANTEAIRHVDAGLALIPRMPQGSDSRSIQLGLQLARAYALTALKNYTAPETVAALTAAKDILEEGVGTDLQRFSVLHSLCSATYLAGKMEPALVLARQFVDVANRQADPIYRLVGYGLLGRMQLIIGRGREALAALQQAEQFSDRRREKLLCTRFGQDPGLAVLSFKVPALMRLGRLNQASQISEQLRAQLASHTHAPTIAACTLQALVFPQFTIGNSEAFEWHCAELAAHGREKKLVLFSLIAANLRACARAIREPSEESLTALRSAIEASHRNGSHMSDAFYFSHLAEASIAAGDVAGAEAALREAFAYVEQSCDRSFLAGLYRVAGQVCLKRPERDLARAEASFLKAIDVAHNQEAPLLELRAATDLAKLWRDTGSPNDPCALLEPILATIEGGETTRDVRNARALLAETV